VGFVVMSMKRDREIKGIVLKNVERGMITLFAKNNMLRTQKSIMLNLGRSSRKSVQNAIGLILKSGVRRLAITIKFAKIRSIKLMRYIKTRLDMEGNGRSCLMRMVMFVHNAVSFVSRFISLHIIQPLIQKTITVKNCFVGLVMLHSTILKIEKEYIMRKLSVLLLAIAIFLSIASLSFAESATNPASDYTELRVYNCIYTGGSGVVASAGADVALGGGSSANVRTTFGWAIPISSIRAASSKIVGWKIQTLDPKPGGTFSGVMASLHDLSSVTSDHAAAEAGMTNSTLFCEAEATTADPQYQMWFPYPVKLTTQLGVFVEASVGAVVSIYYIR